MPRDDGARAADGAARLLDAGELLGVVRLGHGDVGDRAFEVSLGLGGETGFRLRLARTGRGGFAEVRPAPPDVFILAGKRLARAFGRSFYNPRREDVWPIVCAEGAHLLAACRLEASRSV